MLDTEDYPMISNGLKVFAALSLCLGGSLAACAPEEDSGECSASAQCPNRGEVCNTQTFQCELSGLDADSTIEGDAPASFSNVGVPFFRGKVCVAKQVQPGQAVPVKVSTCLNPCVTPGGYSFKKQYRCEGSRCESLVLMYYPKASGSACPADAFAKFTESDCVYDEQSANAGPFTLSTGPVSGTASVELPFLSNEDIKTLEATPDSERVDKTWALAYAYPADSSRVFSVSINASNPAAPADCSDESECDCREIGF